jgi:hypothetical protein
MIVQTIETIATQMLDMYFRYGTAPALNLYDGKGTETADSKYCLWLLPVDCKPFLNEYNKPVSYTWDVAMFICTKGDIDGGTPGENGEDYYLEKWTTTIKPLYDQKTVDRLMQAFTCDDTLTLSNVSMKEVMNIPQFDFPLDGLYLTFTIKQDLI